MILRSLEDLKGTPVDVTTEGKWNSVRMLVAADRMGFSFHITTIFAGVTLPIHYEHHLEAVYCTAGTGRVERTDGTQGGDIRPGVLYALDQHDQHVLTAETDLTLICVFNPAVTGHEKHTERGGYAPVEDAGAAS